MMSRRRPRRPPKNAARRSTRADWLHPVCDRSWSNTRIRCRARAMSSSMAATCWATVVSSTLRGPGEGSGGGSADMEEAIAIPAIEPWPGVGIDRAAVEPTQIGNAPERGPTPGRPAEALAVDEQVALIIEQLRASIQAQAVPRGLADEAFPAKRACRRREQDRRFRLGQVRAEKPDRGV